MKNNSWTKNIAWILEDLHLTKSFTILNPNVWLGLWIRKKKSFFHLSLGNSCPVYRKQVQTKNTTKTKQFLWRLHCHDKVSTKTKLLQFFVYLTFQSCRIITYGKETYEDLFHLYPDTFNSAFSEYFGFLYFPTLSLLHNSFPLIIGVGFLLELHNQTCYSAHIPYGTE